MDNGDYLKDYTSDVKCFSDVQTAFLMQTNSIKVLTGYYYPAFYLGICSGMINGIFSVEVCVHKFFRLN